MMATLRKTGWAATERVDELHALEGRATPTAVTRRHLVLGTPLVPPFPPDTERAIFAMGCFWGAERIFWQIDGVHTTAVGYCGGFTPNPTYEEVCTGRTGHAESVLCVFRPASVSYEQLLVAFFEGHDPTQGMRQGNDVGTQYRSGVFATSDAQLDAAKESAARYQERLYAAGFGQVTTELLPAGPFYYAEEYHQQYLAANPGGYCGLGSTGVSCPAGVAGLGG
ncbi:MAG: peptide-methionine (S)-S-oxide reductase MsrA [Actinomycetota bacterium]|nr:peptide-methionine (S)-S-oxide reductase MsrA [Actinomycetota bacterium]